MFACRRESCHRTHQCIGACDWRTTLIACFKHSMSSWRKSLLPLVIGGNVEFCFDIVHSVQETSFNHWRHNIVSFLFSSIQVRFPMYPSNIFQYLSESDLNQISYAIQWWMNTLFASIDANLSLSLSQKWALKIPANEHEREFYRETIGLFFRKRSFNLAKCTAEVRVLSCRASILNVSQNNTHIDLTWAKVFNR